MKNAAILILIALVVALPFLLRQPGDDAAGEPGAAVLVVVTPHNEAIRHEFGRAFADWHRARYGQAARVDWRVVGGASEIMRYLESVYTAAFRAWWLARGEAWPAGGAELVLDRRFDPRRPPPAEAAADARAAWDQQRALVEAFRGTDDPAAFTSKIDVFFGGGAYDHDSAGREGLTVALWPDGQPPPDTVFAADGSALIPAALGGEVWRTDTYCGAALSAFGICYNPDRLRDLGIATPPRRWADLADPALAGQVAVADPSKSGSIAKAFEMIVQQQCWEGVRAAGFTEADVARYEPLIRAAALPPGGLPEGVPAAYQRAVEAGWLRGVRLVQRIGANARYFTDSGGKVAIDVSVGDAAAGIVIDFFGRFQAEYSHAPDGTERLVYVTPAGGSSVSADPISVLRGAEHRELAQRFVAFVLSEEGQRLWNYAPGAPGGPARYALRRLPIRRDFYPAEGTNAPTAYARHRAHYRDDLGSPDANPYALAAVFSYQPRWTAAHFGVLRDLVRAMCMDAGDELQAAWRQILQAGGPAAQPEAMALLERLPDVPEPLTWSSSLRIPREHDRLDYLRQWTQCFRESYREAGDEVEKSKSRRVEKAGG